MRNVGDLIREHFFEKNLCAMEEEMNERTRRLSSEEEAKLLEFADQDLTDAIALTLDTGLRRGALFALELRDIDMTKKHLVVRAETQKHGEGIGDPFGAMAYYGFIAQVIPLTARALEIVKRRATIGTPLFDSFRERNSFTRAWYRCSKRPGSRTRICTGMICGQSLRPGSASGAFASR